MSITDLEEIVSEGRCQGYLDFSLPVDKLYGRAPIVTAEHDWVGTLPVGALQVRHTPCNLWLSLARRSYGNPWGASDDDWHLPVLDVDIPRTVLVDNDIQISSPGKLLIFRPKLMRWVPSTTPGHHHVYIDWPFTWGEFTEMLITLNDRGVIEDGYLRAARNRGYTAVRKEGVLKPVAG